MTRLIETAAIFQQEDPATHDLCESGWTGDRCSLPLFHDGPHDNDEPRHNHFDDRDARDDCPACRDLIRQAGG